MKLALEESRMHTSPADHSTSPCNIAANTPETAAARDESTPDRSINVVSNAQADAAVARAHAMFNRVLAGWAQDVLCMERRSRVKRRRAAEADVDFRSAA